MKETVKAQSVEGNSAVIAVAPVRVARAGSRDDIRAVLMIWKRELIRFFRNRIRMVTSLAQPLFFLFVLGTGLSPVISGHGSSFNFRTFMFPGVLGMTILFTAIFSAVSIVWDREFGFLREMLVAPVGRWSLVVGKCLGGASVATFQGVIVMLLAGGVGVPYAPTLMLTLLGELALTAFCLTAFGVAIAARIRKIESFQVVMQLLVMPMFFLAGAVFPLSGLPRWLSDLTKIDPLSYAVDPMRRAVFHHIHAPTIMTRLLDAGVTWNGWRVPTLLELGIIAAISLIMLAIAVVQFSQQD
ncbi:MAG: ABC transporter permease [Actinobacteria bacterium]|nr:ABC transporter permease [Actinomycetota bacterium]MCL6105070.1 ABC transporter permease [Actinomycetota bacterium]